jgi:hypothetical protein
MGDVLSGEIINQLALLDPKQTNNSPDRFYKISAGGILREKIF